MAEERTSSLLYNQQVIVNGGQGNGIGGTVRHKFENNMLFKTMERFIAKKQVWGDCFLLLLLLLLLFFIWGRGGGNILADIFVFLYF